MTPETQAAYNFTLQLIANGTLKDGQHINASIFCEEHGFTQTHLTKAFLVLQSRGWLTKFASLGWFVGQHTELPKVPRSIRSSGNPLIMAITARIVEEIENGVLAPGTPLHKRAIAERFDISASTVSKVINSLVISGKAAIPKNSQSAFVAEA